MSSAVASFPARDKGAFLLFPVAKSGPASVNSFQLTRYQSFGKTVAVLDVLPFLSGKETTNPYVLSDASALACQTISVQIAAQGAASPERVELLSPLTATARQAGRSVMMFLRKASGAVDLTGAYFLCRAAYNKQGSIDYTDPRLPDPHPVFPFTLGDPQLTVLEAGTISEGAYVPEVALLAPGRLFGSRAGLARSDVFSSSGTVFCLNASSSYGSLVSIAFPFVPDSDEHCLIGLCPVSSAANAFPAFGFSLVAGRGFAAGSPSALWLRDSDHATLVQVAFSDGAVASTRHPDLLSNYAPLGAEWEAWAHSQFPTTISGCSTSVRVYGDKVGQDHAISEPRAVVWGERKYLARDLDATEALSERWQSHPTAVVNAKAAALQTHIPNHFDENAAYLIDQPAHGKFVFSGKKLMSLSVEFSPYLTASAPIPTGSFTPGTAPASQTGTGGFPGNPTNPDFENDLFVGNDYWEGSGSEQLPAGGSTSFVTVSVLSDRVYSGKLTSFAASAADGAAITATIPAGDVSAAVESQALLSLSRSFPQTRLPNASQEPLNFHVADPQCPAPPTGEYELLPFSFGGIQSAPGVFRYAGNGDWSVSGNFVSTQWHSVATFTTTWQPLALFPTQYVISTNVSRVYNAVTCSQSVELSADHVEIYAIVGSRLQQAGAYATRPDPLNGATEEQVREFEHDVITQPKGQLRSVVDYVEGDEPQPVLTVSVFARTVMRSSASVTVDQSSLTWPYSFSTDGPEPYNSAVIGLGGAGTTDNVLDTHHAYGKLDYTFTQEQTSQLLNGETVTATDWQSGNPSSPLAADFASPFFKYKMRFSAVFENV
jgi:hypothetical protein